MILWERFRLGVGPQLRYDFGIGPARFEGLRVLVVTFGRCGRRVPQQGRCDANVVRIVDRHGGSGAAFYWNVPEPGAP